MFKKILLPLLSIALVVGFAAPVAAVPPDPVTPLTVTAVGTTITATWGASVGATSYEVNLDGPTPGNQITAGITASFANLLAGDYILGVSARNADGSNGFVTQAIVVVAVAPGVPTGFSASLTPDGQSVTVAFAAPASNGGSVITGYVIARTGTSSATLPTTSLSELITGLAPGTYSFTVAAVNSAGTGLATAPATVTIVAPVTAPSVPTGVVASVSGQTVSVVWGAPVSNGGDPNISYTVALDGVGAVAGSLPSASFGNVAAGSHSVTVTATNSGGSTSAVSNTVTVAAPVSAPGVPTGFSASLTPDGQSVTVAFAAPASNGGSVITGYVIARTGTSSATLPTTSLSELITGLAPGTYSFTVAAVNSAGTGLATAPATVTIVAPITLPGVPGSVTASVSGQTITVIWSAPTNGGDPNLNYTVSIPGAGTATTTSSLAQFTSVPSGTYSATVTATNSVGTGGAGISNSVSVVTVPGTVGGLLAGAEGSSIIVVWNAPTDSGNRPITGYAVRLEQSGSLITTQNVGATATGVRFEGRSPGIYRVVVLAQNDQGTGLGVGVNVVVGSTTPSAPANVSGTAAFQTVTVTWDPPLTVGNTALGGYRINIGAITQTVGAGTRSVVFSSVPEGTHIAQVWAINGGGEGLPGESESFISETVYAPFSSAAHLISQQYTDFLGRPADAQGLRYWEGVLGGDRSQGPVVIQNFMRSKEFAPRRSIARLYLAFFDRPPDRQGFDYWARLRSQGAPLNDVAASFAGSAEFKTTYGELSDAEFIALVYNNVLLRSPDLTGFRFWIGRLQDPSISRGDLMVAFSESPEFVRNSNPAVDVIMTYRGMLDRAPDVTGFSYWVGQVGGNPDALKVLIANFMVSQEYYNRVR